MDEYKTTLANIVTLIEVFNSQASLAEQESGTRPVSWKTHFLDGQSSAFGMARALTTHMLRVSAEGQKWETPRLMSKFIEISILPTEAECTRMGGKWIPTRSDQVKKGLCVAEV